ncbi:hypothetical protein BVIR_165 [Blastochloris viridis]|uniref:Uncharacterized protein n=1 Tax=Blastochloris viridis TaxID=1079 RepID=A0A0P0JHT0_BLAVI|nr:hypothetical protein BVIR_165 [Blastochloris viridis]CUU43903.1 hypothetical protein BVIRIDIS_29310 [Blastochloris viridis]
MAGGRSRWMHHRRRARNPWAGKALQDRGTRRPAQSNERSVERTVTRVVVAVTAATVSTSATISR